jgi:hypothetical protein
MESLTHSNREAIERLAAILSESPETVLNWFLSRYLTERLPSAGSLTLLADTVADWDYRTEVAAKHAPSLFEDAVIENSLSERLDHFYVAEPYLKGVHWRVRVSMCVPGSGWRSDCGTRF